MPEKDENTLIPKESRDELKKDFEELVDPVNIEVFTDGDQDNEYNSITIRFARELAELSDKLLVNVHSMKGDEMAGRFNVNFSPTTLFSPEKYNIRFTGAPVGHEGISFITALMLVSSGDSKFTADSKKKLASLTEKRHVQVFSTPGCPYCPGQVINGFKAAVERPDLVSAEGLDANEAQELSAKYKVSSVPHTVINGISTGLGLEPEEQFIPKLMNPEAQGSEEDEVIEIIEDDTEPEELDVIIAGAGPAGLTAGIYVVRSGLTAVVLEGKTIGGQVATTPEVENYPGFRNIAGTKLMEMIAGHTRGYVQVKEGEMIKEVKLGKKVEVITNRGRYLGKAIILATGTAHRKLEIPGEAKYSGAGVSYCATCDGYFYKQKKVFMVGGGASALTDALYLKNLGAQVVIIHRKEEFRAENYLQESIQREEIPVLWNTVVEAIVGDGEGVKEIIVRNLKTDKQDTLETDGVFVAVGELPNSELALELGVESHEGKYIKIDRSCRTNIPRLYAAGDVTGGVRQIVTAIGEGATAALSAFEDISHPYWKK